MNAPEFRERLHHIVTVEIPKFALSTQPPPLPIIDASVSIEKIDRDSELSPTDVVSLSPIVGLRKFTGELSNEIKALDKYMQQIPKEGAPPKPLSTNAPYLLAVWDELKISDDVVAICRQYPSLVSSPASCMTTERSKSASEKATNMVKVDVTCNRGLCWARINTITTDRLVRELYELGYADYDSGSDSGLEEPEVISVQNGHAHHPAQLKECSIVQLGQDLHSAAQSHSQTLGGNIPQIHIRFTRLLSHFQADEILSIINARADTKVSPLLQNQILPKHDQLIVDQLLQLSALNIKLSFGSSPSRFEPIPPESLLPTPSPQSCPESRNDRQSLAHTPTPNINLDLSLLVAIVSDITHSILPEDESLAHACFRKLSRKQQHIELMNRHHKPSDVGDLGEDVDGTGPENTLPLGEHARSLAMQSMQEKRRGLLDEIRSRCYPSPDVSNEERIKPPDDHVRFWTTQEARDRFLAIVDKIGGRKEKIRGHALFPSFTRHPIGGDENMDVKESNRIFWDTSRYPYDFIPNLIPIQIHSELGIAPSLPQAMSSSVTGKEADTFIARLRTTCLELRSSSIAIDPTSPSPVAAQSSLSTIISAKTPSPSPISGLVSASMMKIGPSIRSGITSHTLRSLLLGMGEAAAPLVGADTEPFMTTLTANKSSITNVVKRMNVLFPIPLPASPGGWLESEKAVIWIVEPRSLSEGMRADNDG